MNQEIFDTVAQVIAARRTIKPAQMNGLPVSDELVKSLLQLAAWAPNHGNTEPWQFFVWAGAEKVKDFCRQHAELYKAHTQEASYNDGAFDKLLHMGDRASHVIIAVMRRGILERIPVLEEIAATSAAVQNLLIGAAAAGIAAYWGSGGMVLKPAMKEFLGLREEDIVMGAIYLGQSDVVKKGSRVVPGGDEDNMDVTPTKQRKMKLITFLAALFFSIHCWAQKSDCPCCFTPSYKLVKIQNIDSLDICVYRYKSGRDYYLPMIAGDSIMTDSRMVSRQDQDSIVNLLNSDASFISKEGDWYPCNLRLHIYRDNDLYLMVFISMKTNGIKVGGTGIHDYNGPREYTGQMSASFRSEVYRLLRKYNLRLEQ